MNHKRNLLLITALSITFSTPAISSWKIKGIFGYATHTELNHESKGEVYDYVCRLAEKNAQGNIRSEKFKLLPRWMSTASILKADISEACIGSRLTRLFTVTCRVRVRYRDYPAN